VATPVTFADGLMYVKPQAGLAWTNIADKDFGGELAPYGVFTIGANL
jgi:hypothetical protein